MSRWPLLVADFRREYGVSAQELARMALDEFLWLMQGLSRQSRFVKAYADRPRTLYSPDDIKAVHAAARR